MKSPTVNRSTFEGLEPRLMLSVGLDALAGSQSIESIPVGSVSVDGSIDSPGQADMYQFTTEAAGKLQIDMHGDGGLNSYLQIFNAQGRQIRSNNNARRGTTDSMVRMSVRAGTTYYIRASGKGTSGGYDLTISSFPTDDYGNTLDAAKLLRLGGSGSAWLEGKINYRQDVDMLAFVARQSGTLNAQMQAKGNSAALVPELAVYDEYGQEISASGVATAETSYTLAFEVTAGRMYYLRAGGGETEGAYRIHLWQNSQPVVPPSPPPQPFTLVVADNMAPGGSVAMRVVDLGAGQELVIAGTDQADTITVSQSGEALTVTTLTASQSFLGISGVVIATFDGDDRIRITNNVTASVWVDAGAGNDSIFDAGSGTSTLLGGEGDDLLVSVGGGKATLLGGEGLDSFWTDSADVVGDASASEIASGSVHVISSFYQPYTNDQQQSGYVPLTIAGQNFFDPLITAYASRYANFSSVPLFVNGPQYTDVSQGAVGDCYYLATLASLADTDPQTIRQAITELGDGTYAVRFYRNGQAQYVRVDGDLPVTAAGYLPYADLGKSGALWVPLMEKAYAFFRTGGNSYSSLDGGWMETVYREVTNAQATTYATTSGAQMFNLLDILLDGGHATTLASRTGATSPIVGSHAYMVKSVQVVQGVHMVTVYNPWGIDGRGNDGSPYDGLITLTIDQVMQDFMAAVFSAA